MTITSAETRDDIVQVAIIVGSTRPGRQAASVARWVQGLAAGHDRASFEVVDIADFDLPLLDEDLPPMAARYARPHTQRWAATIERFDAFVLVTPEYNHSPSAALKNALDFLYAEWNDKAVAFVSYGIDGGIRAVEHLRQIAGELQLADIRAAVSLSFAADFEGYTQFRPAEGRDSAVAAMLDDLLRWGRALKSMRTAAVPPTMQRGRAMPTVVIRYQLHPDQVETQLRLLDDVYREMHTVQPRGLSYTTSNSTTTSRFWPSSAAMPFPACSLTCPPSSTTAAPWTNAAATRPR